jgi:uncharacterized protein YjbJ (UPF0337 family)
MVDSDRIEGTVRQVKGNVEGATGKFLGDTKSEVEGRLDDLAGHAQATYGHAKDAARGSARALRAYAEDRPMQALVIAGLIGFGLGLIAARR